MDGFDSLRERVLRLKDEMELVGRDMKDYPIASMVLNRADDMLSDVVVIMRKEKK